MKQLIEKSAVVAELESKIKEWRLGSSSEAKYRFETYTELLDFIDSLQDKCDGCNNVKGCVTCKDGSEWAHYEEPVSIDFDQKPYGQRAECLNCQFNYAGECKGSCVMKIGEQKVTYTTIMETGDGGINALVTRDIEAGHRRRERRKRKRN